MKPANDPHAFTVQERITRREAMYGRPWTIGERLFASVWVRLAGVLFIVAMLAWLVARHG